MKNIIINICIDIVSVIAVIFLAIGLIIISLLSFIFMLFERNGFNLPTYKYNWR